MPKNLAIMTYPEAREALSKMKDESVKRVFKKHGVKNVRTLAKKELKKGGYVFKFFKRYR